MEPIEVIDYKGYKIEIHPDDDPVNPREWDNLGEMICFHNHYGLGDKHNYTVEEARKLSENDDYISLPLYLYDHSGIGMSTHNSYYPFNCPWDAGQVGWIVVSKDKVRKEYGWKAISRKRENKIKEYLQDEVSTYNLYLEGGFVGFIIEDTKGGSIDSCWGFDDIKYAISEAKDVIDYSLKEQESENNSVCN